jgi:hypothetical protein
MDLLLPALRLSLLLMMTILPFRSISCSTLSDLTPDTQVVADKVRLNTKTESRAKTTIKRVRDQVAAGHYRSNKEGMLADSEHLAK